ncbi:High-affinity nicotinic acid transporter-like protein [Cladobotryum mycophilum]|uniref:High-affinity nicotinic acid transporter-like protein n=1 Tax=Cladobotryum mycophilum TaxID=491253 RepID=A0ABR0SPM5_9HYPO
MDSNDTKTDVIQVEHDDEGFTPEEPVQTPEEKALQRSLLLKADFLIVGVTALVFLVNQWDRGNIGNARIMGFQKDLHMSDGQFYNAVSLCYVGYVICIIPANLSIRFFKAHRQIGGCVILFATLSCCMAAAKNAASVLSLRILFGFVSTFLQALTLYTSLWYRRNELATRSGIFYSAATIAGGFSGLISYAIQKRLDGVLGNHAWQWLFIIQGVAGIAVGITAWLVLPPPPDQMKNKKHWVFSEKEIDLAIRRLKTYNEEGAGVDVRQLLVALKDPKTLFFALMNAGISLGLASISAFLPSFIVQFHLSPVENVKVKISGTCLITMGIFPSVTLLGAWTNINVGGFTKRAVTWGVAEVIGQCFAIMASHIYTDPPQYVKGHSICLAFQLLALASAIACLLWMKRLNRLRDEEAARHREAGTAHPLTHQSLEEAYDYHPSFRYIL